MAFIDQKQVSVPCRAYSLLRMPRQHRLRMSMLKHCYLATMPPLYLLCGCKQGGLHAYLKCVLMASMVMLLA